MEFIVALTIVVTEMLFINLFEIVKIVRAFRIHALVYNKVFAIFLVFEIVRAMRTLQDSSLGETVIFRWREMLF